LDSVLKEPVIAVPVVNTRSFEQRTPYVNPIDNLNIEGIYPGDPNGGISHRISNFVLEEVDRSVMLKTF
jgi:predicted deacylase